MHLVRALAFLSLLATGLVGCGGDLDCGEGTHEEDGACVSDTGTDTDTSSDTDSDTDTDTDTDSDTEQTNLAALCKWTN